jgi:hypothetical protein
MLNSLFDQLNPVPPVPPLKNHAEPLQPTNDGAVPPVPPVPPKKTKTESKKQRVLNWLAYIGETDPAIIEDTLNRCRADQETLKYFLHRANETDRSSNAAF